MLEAGKEVCWEGEGLESVGAGAMRVVWRVIFGCRDLHCDSGMAAMGVVC